MKRAHSLLVAALALLAWTIPVAAQDRISISYLVGGSAPPVKVIQQLGLDKKHGFEMDAREFVDIEAMDRAFAFGEHDLISSLSLNTFANYLNQGHDFVMVLGTLYVHSSLVVPKSSPIKTLADLKDKRVGVYGINASSTAVFGVICRDRYGLDIKKDMKIFGSVPPALPTLLAKGEVDAILNIPPFVPRMVATGEYRVVTQSIDEWKKITGHGLPFAFMIASRKTLTTKAPVVRKMVAAWREAADHIHQHPEVLNAFLESVKITDPAAQKLAQQIMVPYFMNNFTEKDVENIKTYWAAAVKYGFIQKPVQAPSWYTFEFVR